MKLTDILGRNTKEYLDLVEKLENIVLFKPKNYPKTSIHKVIRFIDEKHKLRGFVCHSNSNGGYGFEIYRWNFDNTVGKWERLCTVNGTHENYDVIEEKLMYKLIDILENGDRK